MAYQPKPPFPKSRGDAIRPGDWNEAVNEVVRLDQVVVGRPQPDQDRLARGLVVPPISTSSVKFRRVPCDTGES